MTRTLRTVALTLLCGFALLLGTGVASAHTRLIGSDPADGTTLDAGPARVSLEFNETMQADFSTITVVGPDGTQFQTGEVTADGGAVGIGVSPLGAAGVYEIGYRVISEDGHPVTGSVAFTLTTDGPAVAAAPTSATPGAATPAPAAAAPAVAVDEGGTPVWPWIVGAVVLVGGGVGAALRFGRS
ncbi:copper resistance CopC family protein [Pseudonocardia abyssalis]|uniref:Copper resistance protein CopC n=2 Tax=Pseudonocardia abyssalis TaxID=2792008 RepID=A0ABS6UY65_9PSEU|nr:copper resistance CopC family protein [Pseudonocardia abyssalis]MBW0137175.1 copper resistance protein CopC [Pseudonocardia abyssalis]